MMKILTNKNRPQGLSALIVGMLVMLSVLAVAVLVPSSVPLMVDMQDPQVIVSFDSMEVLETVGSDVYTYMDTDDDYLYYYISPVLTRYGLCMAIGAALAFAITLRPKDPAGSMALGLTSGAFALAGSHLLYYAVRRSYVLGDLNYANYGIDFIAQKGGGTDFLWQFWKGGYTMYGAILGGLLGAAVYALIRRKNLASTIEVIVPGMLLLLAVGRFAEHFTGDVGFYVVSSHGSANARATEALPFLPFIKAATRGKGRVLVYRLAVYAYEALIALVALGVCLVQQFRKAPAGRAAETGLVIVSAWQVLMESWRGDESIKFGFVSLNMLAAGAVMAFILVTRIIRSIRRRRHGVRTFLWAILRVLLFAVGGGLVIGVEFALEGKIPKLSFLSNTQLYGVMTLGVIAMMSSVVFGDGRIKEELPCK